MVDDDIIEKIEDKNKRIRNLESTIKEYERQAKNPKRIGYLISRCIEIFCCALFVFGFLWNGTEVLDLSTPQFLMLYGGSGAVICEVLSRILGKKKNL